MSNTKEINKKNPSFGDLLLLRQFSVYIRPYRHILFLAFVAMFLLLGLEIWRPLIIKHTIDEAFPKKDMNLILYFAGIYLLNVGLSIVMTFLQNYLFQYFGQRVIYEIRNKVFFNILSQSRQKFSEIPIGNLVTRVTGDTEALRSLYTDVIFKMGRSFLLVIGIIIVMFTLDVKLTLVAIVILPIMATITGIYQKHARKAFRGVRSKVSATNTYVQEVLNFIVVIKTYLGKRSIKDNYDTISEAFLKAGLNEVHTFSIFRPIVDFLYFLCILSILGFTNWFDSTAEAGTVFAFIQYVDKFFQPIKEFAEKYNIMQSSLAGAERLLPILQDPPETEIKEESIPPEFREIKEISFENVWFSYDNNEIYALEDITFKVNGGEFVGIVGISGSGKSTLMSLLMGFYRPTKGRICINGYDIAAYSPRILREITGYVFQDSHLFKGTIRENLSLYEASIPQDILESAAKKASLHDMIMNLPKQYDTTVGYLGSLLSQGQKQLLALARVLVRPYKLLIFDEATANIDSDTENKIQESIEHTRGEKTIISIAHRLSTVRSADAIYVMRQGRIVEEGRFDELLDKRGELYFLWSKQ